MITITDCQPQKVNAARVSRVQPHLAGALHRVVTGGKLRTAGETENHQAGVQRAQTAEGGPWQVEVHFRPYQLRGDQDPHRHAHNTPENRRDNELADDLVVISLSDCCCTHGQFIHGCKVLPGHPVWHGLHCRNPTENKTGSGIFHLCGSDVSAACGHLPRPDTVFNVSGESVTRCAVVA
jgi:hypothetical protein